MNCFFMESFFQNNNSLFDPDMRLLSIFYLLFLSSFNIIIYYIDITMDELPEISKFNNTQLRDIRGIRLKAITAGTKKQKKKKK